MLTSAQICPKAVPGSRGRVRTDKSLLFITCGRNTCEKRQLEERAQAGTVSRDTHAVAWHGAGGSRRSERERTSLYSLPQPLKWTRALLLLKRWTMTALYHAPSNLQAHERRARDQQTRNTTGSLGAHLVIASTSSQAGSGGEVEGTLGVEEFGVWRMWPDGNNAGGCAAMVLGAVDWTVAGACCA